MERFEIGLFETFSKRLKKLVSSGQPDVYQYDNLSDAFRKQVMHIWLSAIGPWGVMHEIKHHTNVFWPFIQDTLARERGVVDLKAIYLPYRNKSSTRYSDPNKSFNDQFPRQPGAFGQCSDYLFAANTMDVLDIIDLSFYVIDQEVRKLSEAERAEYHITQRPDEAIGELNRRFQENGIGYQFDGGKLIKVSSQYIHAYIVRPAISLLHDLKFRGAEEEFLRAHEYYRYGRYKEAVVDALKAFESTMKAICSSHRWSISPNATAKQLIATILKNDLIPLMLQDHLSGLEQLLIGLPTVRNKTSGHGQGIDPVEIPEYLAAYAIHMAASNIVFLVEAHKEKKRRGFLNP